MNKTKNILVYVVLVLETIILSMQSYFNIWASKLAPTDAAVYKYMGYIMTKGMMPYRDGFDHKGPLLYIYNYLGTLISFWRGIWVLEVFNMALTVFFMYKIGKLVTNKNNAVLITFIVNVPLYAYFSGGDNVEEFALPFIAIATFIFADYFMNDKINAFRLMACGFCFSGVLLLRVNMVGLWVIFCLAVLIKKIIDKKAIELVKFVVFFILGALLLAGPILVWLAVNGAFEAFVKDYIVFNMMYSSSTLSEKINTIFYFIFQAETICAVVAVVYAYWKEKKYFDLVYIFCLAFLILAISVSGRTYAHYAMILVPMFVYPFARLWQILDIKEKSVRIVATIIVIALIIPTWRTMTLDMISAYKTREESDVPQSFYSLIDAITANTDEDDEIFVWGNENNLYLYSQRLSCSTYFYQYPISKVSEEVSIQYNADLEEKLPKVIVIRDVWQVLSDFVEEYEYEKAAESIEFGYSVYVRTK